MGRRIYFDKQKPFLGAQLDRSHWAAQASGIWLFNEGAGSRAVDMSARDRHADAIGTYVYEAGGMRPSAGVAYAPRMPTVIDGQLTYICRAMWDSSVTGERWLLGSRWTWSSTGAYLLKNSDSNLVVATGAYDFKSISIGSWSTTYKGQWRNIAVRWVGTAVTAVVDGVTYNVTADAAPETNLGFTIGGLRNYGTPSELWCGLIDHVYVYHAALTDDQIKSLYEAPYQAFFWEAPVFYSIPASGVVRSIFRSPIFNSPIITPTGGTMWKPTN